ncbi:MAG: hypothetical protein WBL45_01935 [Solirubrobacterales bacterium]
MTGRRAVIGLSLLCALLVCAFAAQSASAIKPIHSLNTTMVTCKKEATKTHEFADAHCDTKSIGSNTGEFKHEKVALGTTTKVSGTNASVTESTKKSEPAVLKGTIGLAKVTIECLKVTNNGTTSTLTNIEPAERRHTVSGFAETEFSECNVKELAKCIVTEPIVSKANVTGVEGMEGPKGEKNAMGGLFVGSGAEERFAEVQFTDKGAEACSLHTLKFPIKGSVVATNGPTTESAQEGKGTGATWVFTPKFKMQTLKLGPNAAEFSTIVTPSNSTSKTPLSMTTGT